MQHDGLPTPRRNWAIATIVVGIFLTVLDSSIANVALPTIARDLGVSPASSVWVVNAFQLVLVATLLPCAALGEIFSYRLVYRWGIAAFTLASLICAASDSLPMLVAGRALQGLGAAAVLSINAALVRHTYPAAVLGRGLALNAAVVAISMALGPSVCAAILLVADWPWLFAVNIPFGAAVLAISFSLPDDSGSSRRFDILGAALNAATFAPLILGIEALAHGDTTPVPFIEIAVALAAGVVHVRRSLGQTRPMAPIDLLRIPLLSLSLVTGMCAFTAHMAASIALPFVLQYGYGRTPEETGLLMTPWPLAMVVVAPLAGRLADKRSAGLLGGIGLAIMCVGLVSLAFLPPQPGALDLAWRMALCGFGFGFFQSPNNRAIISSAPRERAGAAGGLLATARLLGFTLGATVAALLFHLRPADHSPTAPMLTAAAFAAAAALASLTRIGRQALD